MRLLDNATDAANGTVYTVSTVNGYRMEPDGVRHFGETMVWTYDFSERLAVIEGPNGDTSIHNRVVDIIRARGLAAMLSEEHHG